MQKVKKIVAIGPESTGKSSLCKSLATTFDTVWCPEYAREYLVTNGTNYTFNDLLTIAQGQLSLEEKFSIMAYDHWEMNDKPTSNPFLFVDTDMYVMKVWCEYVFGKCHTFIIEKIIENPPDLYLLCHIDLPWAKDELREYPDLQSREELYHMYKDILINQNVPWAEVKGKNEARIETAMQIIKRVFN